ncbi:hypothetical protein [Roseiconus lacunae]|uniref:Uncharacterized protein n=1 Tax=Roseiconus lacunae TaxID=2605694 RepID=A0ABT7PFS8_9BACT|nr:hypothetical protein [Roseiconus lacunae]MCD0461451.1 hypothetical protein [Roseiconus lacunae]MDM4015350.1 hypothetical protein [Roseiconus lacunae]WRQ52972.1 hypothetical protein U8335_10540 [Stieleria sp. HD01]
MTTIVGEQQQATDARERVQQERLSERERLKVSRFDSVTSLFLALILFLGAFVSMMFIVWLLSGEPKVKPIEPIIENPPGRGENPEGFERDFEPPGAEEVEDLQEPTLADTIEAVTDAVSSVAASLTTSNTNATASTQGTGKGDSRPPGPLGEGDDIIGRWERWELTFNAKGKKDYARQLDHYKIQLAAFGGGGPNVIEMASNLSGSPKKSVNQDPKSEERLYFSWKLSNPLMQFDQQLLAAAGIAYSGRNVIRFIPKDLENQLAQMEKEYCERKGKKFPHDIAKTIFESNPDGNGFSFSIVSQRYRVGR